MQLVCETEKFFDDKNNEEIFWTLAGQDPVDLFPTSVRSLYDRNDGLKKYVIGFFFSPFFLLIMY